MPRISRRPDRLTVEQAHAEIERCIPLAHAMVRGRPGDREEHVASALLGLCRAAQTFEPGRGNNFITHAHWNIRRALSYAASVRRRQGMMYVPRGQHVSVTPFSATHPDPDPAAQQRCEPTVTDPDPPHDADEFWRRVKRLAVCRLDYLILRAVFAHGMTQDEVAAALGVSHTRVKQRVQRTIARLRANAVVFEGFE